MAFKMSEAKRKEEPPIFNVEDVISERYVVIRQIGRGGYGEVYQCFDITNGGDVAVKVERVSKPGGLEIEEKIISDLTNADCQYTPRLLDSGLHEGKVNYIVLSLLGPSLSFLRRNQKTKKYSLLTAAVLGMQMIRCIREFHSAGYIHRDIKPGNFVIGHGESDERRRVYMIDFGLSKRYLTEDGKLIPKNNTDRWVGSRRYMSINTHMRKDQGRRDDLWGLLYVLIEFLTGTVPWAHLSGVENLDACRDMKIQYNNERLVQDLPREFHDYMIYLNTLKFESKPDYAFLHGLFYEIFSKHGGDENLLLDWENGDDEIVDISFLELSAEEKGFEKEHVSYSSSEETVEIMVPKTKSRRESKGCSIL